MDWKKDVGKRIAEVTESLLWKQLEKQLNLTLESRLAGGKSYFVIGPARNVCRSRSCVEILHLRVLLCLEILHFRVLLALKVCWPWTNLSAKTSMPAF